MQVLSKSAAIVSAWHPFIYDIYKTFKKYLGSVRVTENRYILFFSSVILIFVISYTFLSEIFAVSLKIVK